MNLATSFVSVPESMKVSQREKLILEYLPLVKRIVNRIAAHLPSTVEIDDLITSGIIGLIQAIDRYEPTRGVKISTFASYRIRGAIIEELRSRDILTRSHRKKVKALEKTIFALEQNYGRKPTDDEIAKKMGIETKDIQKIKKASGMAIISLEEIGYSSSQKRPKLMKFLADGNIDALSLTKLKELKTVLVNAIDTLKHKEQMVVSLYYNEELTMKEIGNVLGITESRVSQIHSQVIIKLRKRLYKKEVLN